MSTIYVCHLGDVYMHANPCTHNKREVLQIAGTGQATGGKLHGNRVSAIEARVPQKK